MFDQRMEALAATQHGVVTHAQAIAVGMSRDAIRHRVRAGRWHPMSRGVYRLAGSLDSPQRRAMAGVLAAGGGAVISHNSAAALLLLPGFSIDPVTISVIRDGRRDLRGTRIEQTLALPAEHWRLVDSIPCTTMARTLFDLCGDVQARKAERALDTALARKLVTRSQLWRVLVDLAEHGRSGTVLMRRLLEERRDDYVAPESELEARLIELARRFGLPEPERQIDLGDEHGWIGRVDFLFRGARVVVEVDGAAFHDGLLDRRSDEARDTRLAAAGWKVLRFRWDDVVNRPSAVAHSIRFQCDLAA